MGKEGVQKLKQRQFSLSFLSFFFSGNTGMTKKEIDWQLIQDKLTDFMIYNVNSLLCLRM